MYACCSGVSVIYTKWRNLGLMVYEID